jgi:radical SAM-linked protein
MQKEYVTFIADFTVQDRFAYLSHQETMSFWQRVLVRAQVPLIFSLGFNPHPRLSLPLPRSVGVQSDCERLCAIVAADGFCAQAARDMIEPLLPEGCTLVSAVSATGKAAFYPVSVTYRFMLRSVPDAIRQEHLQQCRVQIQRCESITLSRHMEKGRQKPINIQPFIEGLSWQGQTIEAVCSFRPEGTVRVDELMRWLALGPEDLAESVRRVAVRWVSKTNHLQGVHHLS